MMRRNGNVINLEAVLIGLPYTALYFLMWLNILIIQGERRRKREPRQHGSRWEMLKMPWRVFTPAASLSLKLFIMLRRYTPLRKTRSLLQGYKGKSREGSCLLDKGEKHMIHIFVDFYAECLSNGVFPSSFLHVKKTQYLAQKHPLYVVLTRVFSFKYLSFIDTFVFILSSVQY